MLVSTLLCHVDSQTPQKGNIHKLTTTELRFLRIVKYCSQLDMLSKKDIQNKLKVYILFEKVDVHKNRRMFCIIKGIYQTLDILRPQVVVECKKTMM